jgi:uncharacterized membrane protein YhaH (DUF805 family)
MRSLIAFIFPARLHRLAYFLRGVTTDVLAAFIYAFSGTNASSIWLVLSCLALAVYQLLFIILPRLRDIGMRNWWLLLIVVPGVNVVFGIILLFRAPVILSDRRNPAVEAGGATPSC